MRVTKRLMAALLACLMLLSLLPVPAYAADDGRIALLAVAQDGYVIEPEYIGYRSGDTVKDVLKNSGHTFSGIDSGFITAVDGRTDNYSLHYDGDGYALDASAKGLTASGSPPMPIKATARICCTWQSGWRPTTRPPTD